jgi:hypothetical protein
LSNQSSVSSSLHVDDHRSPLLFFSFPFLSEGSREGKCGGTIITTHTTTTTTNSRPE